MKHSSLDLDEGCVGLKGSFSWSGSTPLYFHTAASPAIAFTPLSLEPQAALAECWDGAGLLSWALVFFLFFLAFLFLSEGEYF